MDDNKALAITKDISVSVADAICEEGADHVSEIASFVSGWPLMALRLLLLMGFWARWYLGHMPLFKDTKRGGPSETFVQPCLN